MTAQGELLATAGRYREVVPAIVSSINVCRRTAFKEDRETVIANFVPKLGSRVTSGTETPVISVLSRCPREHNPAAGFAATPSEVVVSA